MATIANPRDADQLSDEPLALPEQEHVLLRGISWGTYEALLSELEDCRRLQLTYDDGDLEIMSPTLKHEWSKRFIGRMIEAYTEERGIPIASAGSTTFKLKLQKRGVEPDECYYIQNEMLVRDKDDLDLAVDPPPDLAVEVEVTARFLQRLPIYAALRFPEVWHFRRGVLTVHLLDHAGAYAVASRSTCLPELPLAALEEFLRKRGTTDETSWIREFRSWVRTLVK